MPSETSTDHLDPPSEPPTSTRGARGAGCGARGASAWVRGGPRVRGKRARSPSARSRRGLEHARARACWNGLVHEAHSGAWACSGPPLGGSDGRRRCPRAIGDLHRPPRPPVGVSDGHALGARGAPSGACPRRRAPECAPTRGARAECARAGGTHGACSCRRDARSVVVQAGRTERARVGGRTEHVRGHARAQAVRAGGWACSGPPLGDSDGRRRGARAVGGAHRPPRSPVGVSDGEPLARAGVRGAGGVSGWGRCGRSGGGCG